MKEEDESPKLTTQPEHQLICVGNHLLAIELAAWNLIKRTNMTPSYIHNLSFKTNKHTQTQPYLEVKIRGSSVSTLATHNVALASTGHLEIQTPTRSYNWNRETYELTLGMSFPTQMVCCMLLLWFCMYLSCGSRFRRLERKQKFWVRVRLFGFFP